MCIWLDTQTHLNRLKIHSGPGSQTLFLSINTFLFVFHQTIQTDISPSLKRRRRIPKRSTIIIDQPASLPVLLQSSRCWGPTDRQKYTAGKRDRVVVWLKSCEQRGREFLSNTRFEMVKFVETFLFFICVAGRIYLNLSSIVGIISAQLNNIENFHRRFRYQISEFHLFYHHSTTFFLIIHPLCNSEANFAVGYGFIGSVFSRCKMCAYEWSRVSFGRGCCH